MKKILGIVVLGLLLTLSAKADDIRDFEIEGMSIGDSLLDFFTEKEINNMDITEYPKSDKYIMLGYNSKTKFKYYEAMSFHVKKNDKKFIIHSLKAGNYYKKNFNECFSKKQKIINDLVLNLNIKESDEYEYKYKIDDGNSVAYINDFLLDNTDKIRVWCVNWSEATEVKRNFTDNLAVALNPRYFLNWINNEAGG